MKKNRKYEGYDLIPETTGKISNGVYIRKDNNALIISFAWGRDLHFKPQEEISGLNEPNL